MRALGSEPRPTDPDGRPEPLYIQVVQSYGMQAGSRSQHLNLELYAIPQVPHWVAEEIGGGARQVIKTRRCVWCALAEAEAAGRAAVTTFEQRYGALIAAGLPLGLPTVSNPTFNRTVFFDEQGRFKIVVNCSGLSYIASAGLGEVIGAFASGGEVGIVVGLIVMVTSLVRLQVVDPSIREVASGSYESVYAELGFDSGLSPIAARHARPSSICAASRGAVICPAAGTACRSIAANSARKLFVFNM